MVKPAIILITGAGGFIGSRVTRMVAEDLPDCSVIGVGRTPASLAGVSSPNYEYFAADLLNPASFKTLPRKVDVVMHLAGDGKSFHPPERCTPQVFSNVVATSHLADYAAFAKARLLIFASSVYVYSGNAGPPFCEDSVGLPGENLGATKLAAEVLLKTRALAGQFKAVSLRIFTVYGPGAQPQQFIPQAVEKLVAQGIPARFGAPDRKRDFIYVDDVARAFVKSVSLDEREFVFEALNVGTGVPTSIQEIVRLLAKLLGSEKEISFSAQGGPNHPADTDHQADLRRTRSVIHWEPKVLLEEGLRLTLKSIKNSSGGL